MGSCPHAYRTPGGTFDLGAYKFAVPAGPSRATTGRCVEDGEERGRPRLPPRAGAGARPADPSVGRQEGNDTSPILPQLSVMFLLCAQYQAVVEAISDLHWCFFFVCARARRQPCVIFFQDFPANPSARLATITNE
jgi:hypothetical protein